MSNFSSTAVAKVLPSSTQDLTSVIIYIFEGFILCFFNFLLFLIIYSCKYLRNQKEYIIFAGNILSDGLFGASYFIAGIRRLYIYLNVGAASESYSKWECFTVFHTLLLIYLTPVTGLMSFFTTFDRFLCAMFPHKYVTLTSVYANLMVLTVFLLSIIPTIFSGFESYGFRNVYDQTATCTQREAETNTQFMAVRLIRIVATILGTILYAIVAKRIYEIINPKNNQIMNGVNHNRLISMTFTFALTTFNQIFFFIIPDLHLIYRPKMTSLIFYIMNMNKGIANLFVFMLTQRELRKAMLKRFTFGIRSFRRMSDRFSVTRNNVNVPNNQLFIKK